MMENDNKLISQFMHANKHEIEDNGFSRRVIRQLPEHAKWMSDVLTTVCTVLCCILFYVFDGFNLDFESLKAEAGPHYVQFIREMSVACRKKGLVLSVDNYVPSAYTVFYNRREQGIVADYVIVMGYDEHYAGGEAGPVASLPYVEKGIADTLKEVPKEKVINSVPFYTRIWTEKDGKTTSKAYGIRDAKNWIKENNIELEWQDDLGVYYGESSNENGVQSVWMEEEKSLGLKVDLINEYDLAGAACWKLGFEDRSIWEIVSQVK